METKCVSSGRRVTFLMTLMLTIGLIGLYSFQDKPVQTERWDSTMRHRNARGGLLLFSYMRSGSTVMGEMFRDSPNTFYVFEPLIVVLPFHYATGTQVCNMSMILCRSDMERLKSTMSVKIIQDIFSCNIRRLPKHVLSRILEESEKSGKPWNTLKQCLEKHGTESMSERQSCFHAIENTCKQAKIRVIKVLRISFSLVKDLLTSFSELKVLFLTRDPRAIINSRIRTGWFPVDEDKPHTVQNNVESLCYKMKNDLLDFKNADADFQNRTYLTSIEKLLNNRKQFEDLFHFTNKVITPRDRVNINTVIEMNKMKNLTSDWRTSLKPGYRHFTEYKCQLFLDFSENGI